MGERARRSGLTSTILTWTVPVVLFAASIAVAQLTIRLAPGERPGADSLFSDPTLDLVLFGLVIVSCVACFIWPRSALLTAAGSIGAMWYYSDLYLDRSTSPLAGLIYLNTVPLAVASAICGPIGYAYGRSKARRAREAAGTANAGP